MSKRKKADNSRPIFIAVDRLGLPLEDGVAVAVKKGWTVSAAFLDFLLGAVDAGWRPEKVRSDIREACGPLRLFCDFDAERWLFWADGAFDEEQEDGRAHGTRSHTPDIAGEQSPDQDVPDDL